MNIDPHLLRPIIFSFTVTVMFALERLIPYYSNQGKKRITTNILMFILSVIALRIFFPNGPGQSLSSFYNSHFFEFEPSLLAFILSIIFLDCCIYWQHRIMHIFDPLWRLHQIHHADKQMDFTMGLRFHPLEILFSAFFKAIIVALAGIKLEYFLIYETILSSMAIFNHSNVKFNRSLERFLRYFIVTPDMHWPHHSPKSELMNMNYGNFLSIWDRIFGTYTKKTTDKFGLTNISGENADNLKKQLTLPFQKTK